VRIGTFRTARASSAVDHHPEPIRLRDQPHPASFGFRRTIHPWVLPRRAGPDPRHRVRQPTSPRKWVKGVHGDRRGAVVGLAGVAGLAIENARLRYSERRREWLEAAATRPSLWNPGQWETAASDRRDGGAFPIGPPRSPTTDGNVHVLVCDPDAEDVTRAKLAVVLARVWPRGHRHRRCRRDDASDRGAAAPKPPAGAPGLRARQRGSAAPRRDDRDLAAMPTSPPSPSTGRRRSPTRGTGRDLRPRAHCARPSRRRHPALFATGMQLQAASMRTSDGAARAPEGSVADLDATIRDVRATVFEASTPSGRFGPRPYGPRAQYHSTRRLCQSSI
jgi:hypothetical protein